MALFNQSLFDKLVGPTLSVTETAKLGPVYVKYDTNFTKWIEERLTKDGVTNQPTVNYYDRTAAMYYRYARTGDVRWLDEGDKHAKGYQGYLRTAVPKYSSNEVYSEPKGMALNYAATGSQEAAWAVNGLADQWCQVGFINGIGVSDKSNGRMASRTIGSALCALVCGTPSISTDNVPDSFGHYPEKIRQAIKNLTDRQLADGSWRYTDESMAAQPFQMGMVLDCLIDCERLFEKNPATLPSVKKACEFLWTKAWGGAANGFQYVVGDPTRTQYAPDLTGLIVNAFSWLAQQTGNATDKDRAVQVFASFVATPALDGSKQFNQAFYTSHKSLSYLNGAEVIIIDPPPPPPPSTGLTEADVRRIAREEVLKAKLVYA